MIYIAQYHYFPLHRSRVNKSDSIMHDRDKIIPLFHTAIMTQSFLCML